MPRGDSPFADAFSLAKFFDADHDLLAIIEIEDGFLTATAAWQRVLGWTEKELLGRPLADLMHPDDWDAMQAQALAGPSADGPLRALVRVLQKSGGYRWLDWRALSPVEDGVLHVLARDVTEERRRILHAAEIEAISGVGSWELDVDTGALWWSARTRAIHEVGPDFTPRLADGLSFYPPEAMSTLQPALDRLMTEGAPYDIETPFVTALGNPICVRATAAAERREGRVVRLYGTFQDVTAARADRERLARLGAVAQMTANLVLVTDAERRIEWVNPAFERTSGWTLAEAVGRNPADLVQFEGTDPETIAAMRRAFAAGEGFRGEMKNRAKDGRLYWIDHDIQPLRRADGTLDGFVAVAVDITARRAREARLAEAEAAARLAQARLTAAIEALPDGLVLYDADERLAMHNAAALRLPSGAADLMRIGARFEDMLRDAARLGAFADAVGREEAWVAGALANWRSAAGDRIERLADGRWFRYIDRPTPDGGRVGLRIDITALKQAEERARRAEDDARAARERLLTALDALDDGVIVTDADDRIVVANAALRRLFPRVADCYAPGTPYAVGVRRNVLAGGVPEAVGREEAWLDAFFRIRREGPTPEREIRYDDGRWLKVVDRATPDGGRIGLRVDITRVKQAEAEARMARSRLEQSIHALPDGFITFDADDRIVLYNRRMVEMFAANADAFAVGVRFEDLLRKGVARGLFPDAAGREAAWTAEFLAERARGPFLRELQLNDGRWIRVQDQPLPDGGRIGLRIDVTELRVRAARLEAIIDGAEAGTWEWDPAAGATLYNDRWAGMLGYSLHDVAPLGLDTFFRLVHPDDLPKIKAQADRLMRGEADAIAADFRMRHRDGRWIWVRDRGRVVRTGLAGPAWVTGVHIDISDMKATEAALEEARRVAEAALQARSTFLATMSHEIRTPMNGVLGMAELLEREIDDPRQRGMLAVIRQSGETLLNIINDVLDLSKIESGRLDFEAITFAPTDLVRQIAAAHGAKASAQGLALRMDAGVGAERPRRGDPHRLMQVLHNLVGNAVKFTEAGSVVVAVRAAPDGALTFDISDTGIGMTSEALSHIFEPFSQADSSTTRRYGGTGLGMTIVRRIVEAMGGAVSVESRPGQGTRVRVVVPLPFAKAEADAALAPPTRTGVAGLRVLAADDNEINRMVLGAMLDALGATATIVESGAQALAAAAAEDRYDVILLDITMPNMDGCEALESIRADERTKGRPSVPALAVTANAMEEQTTAYLAAGFAGHLPKPLSLSALETHLRAAVAPAARETQASAAAISTCD